MLVPDVLREGLRVVFCGTALGNESFRQRAYYAHPGNLFWPALHRAGFTPHRISPKQYAEVLNHGIGLTDLCKRVHGNDDTLAAGDFDCEGLARKIALVQPGFLAFTSKKGASVFLERPIARIHYGPQPETIGRTRLFVLPSPSGHARRYWREAFWHELAERAAAE